ncbi:MAG: hypothetical protein AAFQ89_22595 [Cyanobacteria bacterium J06626_18]
MPLPKLKLDRLAIAFVTVLIVADLLPHPSLSAGVIERAVAKVQDTWTESAN